MTTDEARNHEWWIEAIARHFLPPIGPDRTAALSVDRQALADLTGLGTEQAVDSLVRAVRSQLGPNDSFKPIRSATLAWRRSRAEDPPPALPLLALTVVAANDMGGREGERKFDFYRPFRRLLDPTDDYGGAPSDFTEVIGDLWASLDHWLEEVVEGQRGRSSVKPHEHYTYIGYSLAQAVIRGSDRTLLHRFFDALGLDEETYVPAPERLRQYLSTWARRQGPRGSRLTRLATEPELERLCDSILEEELAASQRRPDERQVNNAQIHLAIQLRPTSVALFAQRLPDFPDSLELLTLQGHTLTFEALSGNWYRPESLQDFPLNDVLDLGLLLRAGEFKFEFDPAPILALRYNEELGAYATASRIAYDEAHLLCVEDNQIEALTLFLEQERVEVGPAHENSPLPAGWVLVEAVRFRARPRTDPPPALAALLGIKRGLQPRLVGGLRVSPLRRVYLTGGEPLVQLPIENTHDAIVVAQDDGGSWVLDVPRDDYGRTEISLRSLALPVGHYSIEVGDSAKMTFDMVEAIEGDIPSGTGSVRTNADGLDLCGYSLGASPQPEPVVISRPVGAAVFALGASPEEFAQLSEPAWLAQLAGGLSWSALEVCAEFPVAWLVIEHPGRPIEARPVDVLEPVPSDDPVHKWVRLMRKARLIAHGGSDHAGRLERYREEARRHRLVPKVEFADRATKRRRRSPKRATRGQRRGGRRRPGR